MFLKITNSKRIVKYCKEVFPVQWKQIKQTMMIYQITSMSKEADIIVMSLLNFPHNNTEKNNNNVVLQHT